MQSDYCYGGSAMNFDIRDFGAVGDGAAIDTPAIQKAADACHENGSGVIIIPAGNYVTASVRLYSNTTVRIETGARLLLCTDESQYGNLRGKYDTMFTRDGAKLLDLPEGAELNFMQKMFLAARRCHTDNMFYAKDAENIVIEGDGALVGQWKKFFNAETGGEDGTYEALFSDTVPRWQRRLDTGMLLPQTFRPQFVYMQEVSNVRIRNISLLDCPFFNIRITDSEHIRFENLNILTEKRCQNTDGINLSGCRHCFITGCRIVTGDDCIAISSGEMPPRKFSAEDIVISNCIGSTYSNFFRIFQGIDIKVCLDENIGTQESVDVGRTQYVKNISIANCILEEGGCLANILAVYGKIEHVHLQNITVREGGKDTMIFIAIQEEGKIRDVTFDGVNCCCKGAATVLGTTRDSISRVVFHNCYFYVEPTTKLFGNGLPDPLLQYWVSDLAPYNIYLRHATDVRFQNCEVEWGKADIDDIFEIADASKRPEMYNEVWREDMGPFDSWPCIDACDVDGLDIRNFRGEGFGGCEAVRCK